VLRLYTEVSGDVAEAVVRGFVFPFKADNFLGQFPAQFNFRDPQ
jgi:hypothetical protein